MAHLLAVCLCLSQGCRADDPTLITGKAISTAGARQDVGSLPVNMILTRDGKYVITSDMGYREFLWCLRAEDGRGVSSIEFSNKLPRKSRGGEAAAGETVPGSPRSNGLYYGLAAAPDGTIYAAQGGHDSIAVLHLDPGGKLWPKGSIACRKNDFPAGLALDGLGRLYVVNNAAGGDDPLQTPGSLSVYDAAGGTELGRYVFKNSFGGTSNFPLAIAVRRDGRRAYVVSERDGAVYVVKTENPSSPELAAAIPVGAHPVAIVLSRDERQAFVANSLSDTVSVIDTRSDEVTATILLRPASARELPGATPTALALSPDGKSLFVTLGDMNAVAVVDVSSSSLRGYVPAGWYPSAVVATSNHKLLVTNAKGNRARYPNGRRVPLSEDRNGHPYILNLIEGDVQRIRIPEGGGLRDTTARVLKNNRIESISSPSRTGVASLGLTPGQIRHVVYIIKENRTYDQVLGDEPQGNGDPSLVLFGANVTPNQHALAERFVLLDNVYASGEVSGDGWCWSTQGMADAYTVRNVPYNYSGRGRKFDFEGQNNGYLTAGFPAKGPDGKPLAKDPALRNGAPAIPDVGSTGFAIWDAARAGGVSYRNYGFFLFFADAHAGTVGGPENYPTAAGLQPGGHDLAGLSDLDFRRFDMDYADSDAPGICFRNTGDRRCLYKTSQYGIHKASSRFAEWNTEFQEMLDAAPSGAAVPSFLMLRLPHDHTVGALAGKHSPRSQVADNDYAVGQVVESISRSPIWASTAIFIIEDDAQAGADHVDAHRVPCFVISPCITGHSIDHRFYNTDSVLRTIELLLGLRPMTQYDAIAEPIRDWSAAAGNAAPYAPILPDKELFREINPSAEELSAADPRAEMARLSAEMDFSHPDRAPADTLNQIIWQSVKGPRSVMPKPVNGPFATPKRDDDD